jgi:PAS domain S-box-containing protein
MSGPPPSSKSATIQDDELRLAEMFEQAPSFMALLREPEHRIILANKAFLQVIGRPGAVGRTAAEVLPPEIATDVIRALDEIYRSGVAIRRPAARYVRPAEAGGVAGERILDLILQPITGSNGAVKGIFVEGNDVTERIHAEQRLRSTFAIRTVGILYWDSDFRITEANDAFVEMSGYTRDEAIGRSWQDLTPQAYWALSERAISELTSKGETAPYEKQYMRKDGSCWWGLFAPRRVGSGEIVEFVLDITERKEAEEALREQEQRLRLIVDSASDYAILTLDPELHVTSWSPGASNTFGFPAQEIVGRSVELLFTPEDRGAGVPEREAAEARRTGAAADVRWHVRKDGSRVFIHGSSRVLRSADGEELGFLKIGRDETERRRREVELREAEQRYRLATMATNDAIWDWDLVSGSILWNEAVETLFGYSPEQVGPIVEWWEGKLHADDRGRVLSSLEAAIAGGEGGWSAEYRFERADGGYSDVLDRGTVLRVDGRALRMVGAMHDLTPHREAEATLRQLNETLESRVLEEVAARMRTEDALRQSQKLEAIGQLTGGMAHDFNNLLTVIRGAAEMLRRPSLDQEKRGRYIEAIAETADRAAKLTGQLLAFARRQALKPEVFEAGSRIDAIADMLATVVGPRVHLIADTACDICYVEADSSQFDTAIVNLAVNARDAMEGTGELRIIVKPASRVPAIRGHSGANGDFVAISIADTGAGIPAKKLGQIFEPFYTTKEIGKGTGLGLSQVYGFVKQSGGEVDVESKVGEGTTFTLYLPRVAGHGSHSVEAPAKPTSSKGHGHVLVVEDNEQVGAFSTQMLAELGFETTWAPSADAALHLLTAKPHHFAAVFSDVVMPGMNGVELGQEIRRRQPDLPVILTSGYSHVLAQEGSHGFTLLHKPYSVEELMRVLGDAISGRAEPS